MSYERHALSAAWPDMADEDYVALKDSIGYSGLIEPITLFAGQILDGWHRYRACIETGIEPRFSEFSGEDPALFVRDKHTRRPLTLTQRLTCIALMSRWKPRGGNQSAGPADCSSAKDIAKAAGGGVRSAENVKEAIKKGVPELVQAMKAGQVGAEKAAAIANLPKEEQAAAIAKPTPKKQKRTLTQAAPAEIADYDPSEDALSEARHTIDDLAKENASLKDRLAVEAMDASEEEKTLASETIAELRAKVALLETELEAVKASRDGYMREANELKKSIKYWQREAKKAA